MLCESAGVSEWGTTAGAELILTELAAEWTSPAVTLGKHLRSVYIEEYNRREAFASLSVRIFHCKMLVAWSEKPTSVTKGQCGREVS